MEDASRAFSAAAVIAADGRDGAGDGKFLAGILARTAKAMRMSACSERAMEPVLGLAPIPFPARFEPFTPEQDIGEGGRGEDAAGFPDGEENSDPNTSTNTSTNTNTSPPFSP